MHIDICLSNLSLSPGMFRLITCWKVVEGSGHAFR